jgi:hypothetical protein
MSNGEHGEGLVDLSQRLFPLLMASIMLLVICIESVPNLPFLVGYENKNIQYEINDNR